MKSGLYFSMQRHNESQDAWLRRTAPAYEHRNHSRGLSGRPDRHGLKIGEFEFESRKHGKVIAARIAYGNQPARRLETWCQKNGYQFEFIGEANGCSGMCSRSDGVAYRRLTPEQIDAVYSRD